MHAGVLGPDLIRDLLEVQIDPLRLEMVADFIGEDQGFAVLRFVPPGFPRIAGPLALHNLLRITDFQQVHDRLGRAQCAGLPVLGWSQLRPSIVLGTTLQLLVDDNGPVLEVHTVPGQPQRFALTQSGILVLPETDLDTIVACINSEEPELVIIDSIQTISGEDLSSAPGSVSQVRECTMRIMRLCKEKALTVFIVGHITKEGSIAGPKVLEHMVDCVLYFEGERNTSFRILRAAKNRFGSTNEIGVFEMDENGLKCVDNPSELLLSGRPENAPGTCVACVIEGSRPLLAEVQALVTPSSYNASRRSNGVDYNRAAMLLAVIEKRGGLPVSSCDAYINVIGGLTLDEPAADLATALAIASSYIDRPLGADLAAIGEIGLSGEIRSVGMINQRLTEISRLGFRRCVIPAHVRDEIRRPSSLELIPVKNIREAILTVSKKD